MHLPSKDGVSAETGIVQRVQVKGFLFAYRPAACRGLNGACSGYQSTGKVRVAGAVAKVAPRTERLPGYRGSIPHEPMNPGHGLGWLGFVLHPHRH